MSAAEDFTVIQLKYEQNDARGHQLFVKENASKITCTQKPSGRTLYVLNVPPYATKEVLQEIFSKAGKVERVALQEKPSSKESAPIDEISGNLFTFKVGYVVFKKSSSLKTLLKWDQIYVPNEVLEQCTGVAKWEKMHLHALPDPDTLQQEVDQYMQSYDEALEQKKIDEKNNPADNDGWVSVSKKNYNIFSQKQSVVKKLEKKLDDDRTAKELKNFYTFQIRESKKNDIISLRKKYDRDLKKMEQIKKTKRFKPY